MLTIERPVARFRAGIAALVSALIAGALFTAGAEGLTAKQRRHRCFPHGSTTILVTHQARAYVIGDGLRACLFSTGRSLTLDTFDGELTVATARALAGRFVAWDFTQIPGCKAACPPGVTTTHSLNVMDLRTGRSRSVETTDRRVKLTTRGVLVWLTSRGPSGVSLMVLGARGQRTLDSGDIDNTFLKVFGSLVLWKKAGQGHWVDLAR
jgi:hypothetical protein